MPTDYAPIYALVREVPKGQVASYGMIASLLPGVTSRMVGRALGRMPKSVRAPWHRIVNAGGAIADRPGAEEQRRRLKAEKIAFRKSGKVEWVTHRWEGPSGRWAAKSQLDPITIMETIAGWR